MVIFFSSKGFTLKVCSLSCDSNWSQVGYHIIAKLDMVLENLSLLLPFSIVKWPYGLKPQGLARVVNHMILVPHEVSGLRFDPIECKQFIRAMSVDESLNFTQPM
jgi:hypothetical protein